MAPRYGYLSRVELGLCRAVPVVQLAYMRAHFAFLGYFHVPSGAAIGLFE